jgi:hypothetical protein
LLLSTSACLPQQSIYTHIHILIPYTTPHTVTVLLITIYYTYFILRIYINSGVPAHLSHCLCVSMVCRPHEGCASILQVNTHEYIIYIIY